MNEDKAKQMIKKVCDNFVTYRNGIESYIVNYSLVLMKKNVRHAIYEAELKYGSERCSKETLNSLNAFFNRGDEGNATAIGF